MKNIIVRILITATAALLASWLLEGVYIDNSITAIIVALVLALLNTFVKPILILLTIPITLFTLGLFLVVINMVLIKWVTTIVPGFTITNWISTFWFSIVVSIVSSILQAFTNSKKDD